MIAKAIPLLLFVLIYTWTATFNANVDTPGGVTHLLSHMYS